MDFNINKISEQKTLIDNMLINIYSNSSFSHLLYTKNPFKSVLDYVKSLDESYIDVYKAISNHRMYTEIKLKRVRAQRR